MKLDVFEYSNKGGRSYNEDSVGGSCDGSNGIFIIADGLGGHSLGELASSCAVNVIASGWQGFDSAPQEPTQGTFWTGKCSYTGASKGKKDSYEKYRRSACYRGR